MQNRKCPGICPLIVLFHSISVLNILVFAAHFLRTGNPGATIAVLLFWPLMSIRQRWMKTVLQLGFTFATLFWLKTTLEMIHFRMATDEAWTRMAIIMLAVVCVCGASALLLNHPIIAARFSLQANGAVWSTAAFMFTFGLLAIVQLKVSRPMLLLERFVPGGGWIEVTALSVYSAIIVQKMRHPRDARIWRKRIWLLFAAVFFGQFMVGVLGIDQFLMSGKLHVPVPAVILAGPVFRGEGFFMPILLAVTLLLVGPSWCSHLCYSGGFDLLAASGRKRPMAHRKWFGTLRIALLVATVSVALLLRATGVSGVAAAMVAVAFGAVGIGVMMSGSRKMGTMIHCTAICPIGLVAVVAGKLSPFRMKFTAGCDGCGACGLSCPMGALEEHHIRTRSVGINCTLCGDCLSKCRSSGLAYHFARWHSPRVRMVFLVLVISLHAVFLGVARV